MTKKIFEPYSLGPIQLQNRIVMAPLTRSRATHNIPNDLMVTYYTQRAGAGLIVTEGTSPSPNGLGYPRIPGIFSQEQMAGWKKITDAVHQKGGHIFIQLMHTGRVTHPFNLPKGSRIVAPSAIGVPDKKMFTDQAGKQPLPTPEAMNEKDINAAIQEYTTAAQNAIEAGFDGVELHGANGYLIDQFIHPATNQRTDDYGGSIQNRLRFPVEVARAVAEAIGPERTGIRLSPYGTLNGIPVHDALDETYDLLSAQLSELGLVYLHTVDHSTYGTPEVPDRIKDILRKNFKQTLILSGGYDLDRAEADLQADKGDLIAFGRPFIANPDLVNRFHQSAPIRKPDASLFYTPGPKGYTDYPTWQEEKTVQHS